MSSRIAAALCLIVVGCGGPPCEAVEWCDGVDNDCDGVLPSAELDLDGDGWLGCEECDDGAPNVFPGAAEVCNGVDDDCDGEADGPDALFPGVWSEDADGDGWGAGVEVTACARPSGYGTPGDCDDGEPGVSPLADERCNGVDDDCDGEVDEDGAVDADVWFVDEDGDGYGADGSGVAACTPWPGAVPTDGDCDDRDPAVSPAAAEDRCDGVDDDCSGAEPDGVWFHPVVGDPLDETSVFEDGFAGDPIAYEVDTSGALHVCGGTWYATIVVDAPEVAVIGSGAAVSVLSASGLDSVVRATSAAGSVTVSGITLSEGAGGVASGTDPRCDASGGGAISACLADLYVVDAVLSENTARLYGGAILTSGSDVVVERSEIVGNAAPFGGAMFLGEGSTLDLVDSVVAENTATYATGGVRAWWAQVAIAGSTFRDNVCTDGNGGGLEVWFGGTTRIRESVFQGNASGVLAGGLAVWNGRLELDHVEVLDNQAGFAGGGVWVQHGEAVLRETTVRGNRAPDGGGLTAWNADVDLQAARFQGNEATEGSGGGAWIDHGDLAVGAGSDVYGNTAAVDGGGLSVSDGDVRCDAATIEENTAGGVGGAVVWASGTHTVEIDGCDFGGSSTSSSSPELWIGNSERGLDLDGTVTGTCDGWGPCTWE